MDDNGKKHICLVPLYEYARVSLHENLYGSLLGIH